MESLKNLFKEIFTEKILPCDTFRLCFGVTHTRLANIFKEGRGPWENVRYLFSPVRDTGAWVHDWQTSEDIGSVLFVFLSACSLSLPSSLLPSLHINSNLVWNLNCFRSHYPLMELRVFFIAALGALVCMHNKVSQWDFPGQALAFAHSPDPDLSFSLGGFMFWVSINQTVTGNLMILHIPRKNNKIRML